MNFNELLVTDLLIVAFYAALTVLALVAFVASIGIFRKRPSWGQVRRMGSPFAAFIWIQIVFYLALLEGSIGIVDLFVRIPIWIEISLFGIILILVGMIFVILKRRSTFKPHLFVALILVQLGIPGAHFVARAAEQGAIEVGQKGVMRTLRYGSNFDSLGLANVDTLVESVPVVRVLPRSVPTIAGVVRVKNSFDVGNLGDHFTAKRLTAMGYVKLPSKYNGIHGIDGIYVMENAPGGIKEFLIVENKVGKGRLASRQMTDEWVIDRAEKMKTSVDQNVRVTGETLLAALSETPNQVKKELWHHDLKTGKTTVRTVDPDGKPGETVREWADDFIKNTLVSRCRSGSLQCDLN